MADIKTTGRRLQGGIWIVCYLLPLAAAGNGRGEDASIGVVFGRGEGRKVGAIAISW